MKNKIQILVSNKENDININIIFNEDQQELTLSQFNVKSFDELIEKLLNKTTNIL